MIINQLKLYRRWERIMSKGHSLSPTMFSLKKTLYFNNKVSKLLYKDTGVLVDVKSIIPLVSHENKFTYNCVINSKKYVLKNELRRNIESTLIYQFYYFDKLKKRYPFVFERFRTKEDVLKYNSIKAKELINFIGSYEYSIQEHLPELLEETDNFFVFKYYDIIEYSEDEYKNNMHTLLNIFNNDIVPIVLARQNVAKLVDSDKFIMYDIDILNKDPIINWPREGVCTIAPSGMDDNNCDGLLKIYKEKK
jgi:hypothetical protein